MALIEKMTPDFVHTDARGTLVQLVHTGYRQVNAVFTKKGAVRGNAHYHKHNDEVFYILEGQITVTASAGGQTEQRSFQSGDMFGIKKNIRHTFTYAADTYMVVLYPDGVEMENGEKDIFTD